MHEIKIVDSIMDVSRAEWDAIADNDVFTSYGWLKTAEETFIGDVNPRYVLVKDSNKLIGAAACYIFNKTDLVENLDDLMFGRLKKYAVQFLGISFMPGFLCCPLESGGKHFLIEREADPEKKKTIMHELLSTIEDVASMNGLSPSFIHVMDDEWELMELLASRGYNKSVHIPLSYLDIVWGSFEEYRACLKIVSRNIVRTIRKELNKSKNEGVTIRVLEHPERHEDCLYELLNDNYYKHNKMPFMYEKSFFGRLKQALGENAVFYVSFKKDMITGVCILLKKNKIGHIPMVAVNHEKAGNDRTYFNMFLYRPITDAISDQTRRLYFGRGMYELKARRGCVTKDLYIYYKSFNSLKNLAVKPWFAILSAWNKHKMPKRVRKNLDLARQTTLGS